MSTKNKRKFMQLYTPVHSKFERFCRAKVYGEMDYKDLMQESILIALEKFEAIENEQAFLSFLFGTSIRVLANSNRKIKNKYWEDKYLNFNVIENDGEKQLELEDLYKALKEMSETLSETLILFEISGFSIKEISVVQNISESSVRQRLVRGRVELLTDKVVHTN